jgi:hypothetical protein
LFPEDPQSFFKELDATSVFFTKANVLKPGLTANDMAVLYPLNAVVKRLKF